MLTDEDRQTLNLNIIKFNEERKSIISTVSDEDDRQIDMKGRRYGRHSRPNELRNR